MYGVLRWVRLHCLISIVRLAVPLSAPMKQIFWDLDGSLTGKPNGTSVFYWPHLLMAPHCKLVSPSGRE